MPAIQHLKDIPLFRDLALIQTQAQFSIYFTNPQTIAIFQCKEGINQLEVAIYREELNQKFSGNISANQMFVFILRKFSENHKMLLACKDILRINLHLIPFLNERKQLCKGHLFINNEPEGYYEGNIFPAHIINKE